MAALFARCSESTTTPERIASITVTGASATLLAGPGGGQTLQLSARAITTGGSERTGVIFAWSSDNVAVATVSASGAVLAVNVGATAIRATTDGVSGTFAVTVLAVPVRTLTLQMDSVSLTTGPLVRETRQLIAELRDSTGALIVGRPVNWSSTVPGVATVSPGGLVTAIAAGVSRVVALSEGRADTATVAVSQVDTLPSSADLSIIGAQWTQGVQDDAGSIPIVRGGRSAVLNVLLTATQSIAAPSKVVLRLFDGGGALVRADTASVVVPAAFTPLMAFPSVQFLVPASALQAGRRWQVVRDPAGALRDSSVANDRFPRGAPIALDLVDVPVLRVRFIPIVLTSHNNATGNVIPGSLSEYMRIVRALHPHGALDVSIGNPLPSTQSFGTAPTGGASGFWSGLLAEIDVARVADPQFADAHWIGVVAPPFGFNFSTFGGFGYVPANGASSGPFTRTTALVNVGWFNRESATRELVAHELGHNFGRRHAPCGNAGNPDLQYPIANGFIGDGGHDVNAWENGLTTSAPAVPQSTGDVMGYCNPVWISRYTYAGILGFRGTTTAAAAASVSPSVRSAAGTGTVRTLLVRGQSRGSELTLEPAVTLDLADASVSAGAAAGDDHLVEGFDAAGRSLFTRRFALTTLDHDAVLRPFAVAVPLDDAALSSLDAIVVRGPRGSARRERPRNALLVEGSGAVRATATGAGREVTCPAPAVAVVVQDTRTGAVLGSAQAARLTLPGESRRALRVSCSDGVRTTTVVIGVP